MSSKGYRYGVAWIANEDDPDETDLLTISESIPVALLADLFGKTPADVAEDIVRYRVKQEKERVARKQRHEAFVAAKGES